MPVILKERFICKTNGFISEIQMCDFGQEYMFYEVFCYGHERTRHKVNFRQLMSVESYHISKGTRLHLESNVREPHQVHRE